METKLEIQYTVLHCQKLNITVHYEIYKHYK